MVNFRNTLLIACCLSLYHSESASFQRVVVNRIERQTYFEDSAKVYWLRYADPFSLPTYRNRRVMCQAVTIHSELRGKTQIAILDTKTNQTLHIFTVPSNGKKEHNFWIWAADPAADSTVLPRDRFTVQTESPFRLLLTVNGRRKTLLQDQYWDPFRKGQICYLQWSDEGAVKQHAPNKQNNDAGRKDQ